MSENEVLEQPQQTYPFLIDYLPDEFRLKAEKELNETPENRSYSLEKLKLLAKKDSSMAEIDFHEDLLRQFLRQSKHDVHRALKRLQAFVSFRRGNAKFLSHVDENNLKNIPDYKYCTVLPWRCRDGCAITVMEMSKWDPSSIKVEDLLRLGIMMHHQSLRNPVTQINGLKLIVDWKDSRLRQLMYMSPKIVYATYQAFLACTPARNRELHMVNESFMMKVVWTLFKPFLSEKLKSRVFFHSSPTSLLTYFPKHVLPVQYGGDLENYYMEDWMIEANDQQRLATLSGQCNNF